MIKSGTLRVVRCPICSAVVKTRGKNFFKCCKVAHSILENLITTAYSIAFIEEKEEKSTNFDRKSEKKEDLNVLENGKYKEK